MFVPHGQAVLPRDLQQLHQGAFPLLGSLVVIGQFLEQVGHQVRVVVTDRYPRQDESDTLHDTVSVEVIDPEIWLEP